MSNVYYHFTNTFVPGTKVRSDDMNNELDGITAGFDQLPSDPASINRGTTYVGTESGSGNAFVVARVNVQTSYSNGDHVGFFSTHTNTGSGTLEVDGLGGVALVAPDGSALVASDMSDGVYYEAVFDTANNRWQLMTPMAGTLTEADKRVSWATEWATNAEDTLISTAAGGDGATDYSSLHWSAKSSGFATNSSNSAGAANTSAGNAATSETNASDWASKTGALVLATDYSAKEYAIGTFVPAGSAMQWADEVEDTEVTTGKYSALHWAAKAEASAASVTPGGLIERQVFTASGTWTKPANFKFGIVTVVSGGGGGAGGQPSVAGAIRVGGAGQGGRGASAAFTDALSAATETVTVGAGGAGGIGNSAGTDGISSEFGSSGSGRAYVLSNVAQGGEASFTDDLVGPVANSTTSAQFANVVADTSIDADVGQAGQGFINTGVQGGSGAGGNGAFGLGAGGRPGISSNVGGAIVGLPGRGFGGGGAGSGWALGVGSSTGGAGVDGIVIVDSYA